MARTAITITELSPYQVGTNLAKTDGDQANGMSLDLSRAPKLHLLIWNNGANTVAFTVDLPAGKSTYNTTVQKSYSMTTQTRMVIVFDGPPDTAQSGNVAHISSADANFDDFDFFAMAIVPTPQRSQLVR